MGKAKEILNDIEEMSPGMEIRRSMEKAIVAIQKAIEAADKAGDDFVEKLFLQTKKSAEDAVYMYKRTRGSK